MLKIGMIGVGRWGPNLLRNFHDHRASVVATIADRDARRRAQIEELYPDVVVTSDAAEVIADPTIDAVVVATPTVTHYELVKAALLAGKDVLVEKPLTQDLSQAMELRDLTNELGRVLLVGHVFLYNPAVEQVKQYLEEGELGRPYYLTMIRTNLGPVRTDVDASWDLAAHDVSIANYWLGSAPETASATGGTWINEGVADAVFATLHYPGNVLVNVEVSWLNPRKVRDITIVAEHKMLTMDDNDQQEPIRIYDKGIVDEKVREGIVDTIGGFRSLVHEGDIRIPRVSMGEPLKVECAHFIECIETRQTPRSGAATAVDVVRVLDAVDRSMRSEGALVPVRSG
jgi:predicted dehydrogenase